MSYWGNTLFQDSSSVNMNYISSVYDSSLVIMVFIMSLVFYVMMSISLNSINLNFKFFSSEALEVVWVAFPLVCLFVLALPSLHILYLMEEISNPSVTLKVTGHQWYWSYEYGLGVSQGEPISFDSYMVPSLDGPLFRLLEVDNKVVLPLGVEARVLVTSSDVIHSWSVPSFGVKMDGVPGRLNQVSLVPIKLGNFYGQCSEMCGAMHSFMPIVVEITTKDSFIQWLDSLICKWQDLSN